MTTTTLSERFSTDLDFHGVLETHVQEMFEAAHQIDRRARNWDDVSDARVLQDVFEQAGYDFGDYDSDEELKAAVDELLNGFAKDEVEWRRGEVAKAIVNAESLEDLCAALNKADYYARLNEIAQADIYSPESLPSFGGDGPVEGSLSHDEDSILKCDAGRWYIEPRANDEADHDYDDEDYAA